MKAYLRTRTNAKCYYCLLKWQVEGRQRSKEVSTGIPIKGNNKRKAEKRCEELRQEYEQKYELCSNISTQEMLFADYIVEWLRNYKVNIRQSTYESYKRTIETSISPYFKKLGIRVADLEPKHIREYYQYLLNNNLSANTVKHHHANISKALNDLVYEGVLPSNPASRVKLPKVDKYRASFYEADELNNLLKVSKGTDMELPIILAVYYGLRRSEVCGLKWAAIDFEQKTIEIKSTVVRTSTLIREDNTKSESSHRILPLLPQIEKYLTNLKICQKKDKLALGVAYKDNDYVIKWGDGQPIDPDYISRNFKKILEKNGLRIIRYHDLRHSCASMLISLGYSIKIIQGVLGHADYNTTANIYGHLSQKSETEAFNSIAEALAN